MSDTWPDPPREPGPFAGGPAVGPEHVGPATGRRVLGARRALVEPTSRPARTAVAAARWSVRRRPAAPPSAPGAWGGPSTPYPGGPAGGPTGPAGIPPTAWGAPAAWQQPQGPGPAGPPMRPAMGTTPGDRAPGWLLGLAALVVFLLFAGAAFVLTSDGGPSYPDEWDPRVAGLASWVENERGLEFDHPVHVNFLTAEEYSAESRSGDDSEGLSEEEQAELDDATASLRALGLVSGDVDLQSATDDLSDSGTLAFYSSDTKQVYVRGTEMTPALTVTLVHELTHVLQDQHFDLTRIADTETTEFATLRAIAEGDAGRIEETYVASELTDDERAAYEEESTGSSDEAQESLSEVPGALQVMFSYPYAFGPQLVDLAASEGGNERVNALFEDPPTEASMFSPVDLPPDENGAVDQDPYEVEVPAGGEAIDEEGSDTSRSGRLVHAARRPGRSQGRLRRRRGDRERRHGHLPPGRHGVRAGRGPDVRR